MTSTPSPTVRTGRARELADVVRDAFDAYHDAFRAATRRAARHFEARDWNAVRRDAAERLTLYVRYAGRAIAEVETRVGADADGRDLWVAVRDAYAGCVEGRPDQELAETFFSSVTRLRFATVGVDPPIEFLRPWAPGPSASADDADRRWCAADGDGPAALAAAILAGVPHPLADARGDAARIGAALERAAHDAWGDGRIDGAELLAPVFYRNTGAYVVGRLRGAGGTLPLVVAFRSTDSGVTADAVLTSSDEASVVFGFAWSYFHVDVARPGAAVAFLRSIMPHKRVDELYTAIGYHKHGKTELYRLLAHELARPDARFEEAEGTKGLVMAVFTLPALNIVLKIIRDEIAPPKRTTRRHVMEQYHRVFLRDRVGRLADAQLFQGLQFRRECFPEHLLRELVDAAPAVVRVEGESVAFGHLYTERRVRPLNLYLQEVDAAAAEAAILDYGNAIKELAAANIFPGDLLLKNFGVSRHGRVIFYDYDELALLTECHFRRLPQPASDEDELAAEPWFSVGEHDVFPEEFMPFLLPPGRLRDVFLDAHGELLDPAWWCGVQERQRAGEFMDTYPYPAARRLPA